MLNISLIGSSGSIGTQVKQIVRRYPDRFCIKALTVNSNTQSLIDDIREFKPLMAGVSDTAAQLAELKKHCKNTELVVGENANIVAAALPESDMVFISVVGMCGLKSVVSAINSGKRIALANKESLVAGGRLVMDSAKKQGVTILPVDSEHSAIFQCLHAGNRSDLKRLILTASGGPFRTFDLERMHNVTVEQALKHPTWTMGNKITIDSATLMNKGLEVIEARWLFDIKNIDCIIHPQSIIHSMVEFSDSSVIAQMSYPTMEIPIQLALTYPDRIPSAVNNLDFDKLTELTFEKIDMQKFRCLKLAFDAMGSGDWAPIILNSANESAVELFLKRKIGFMQISEIIENALNESCPTLEYNLDNIYALDRLVKNRINNKHKN